MELPDIGSAMWRQKVLVLLVLVVTALAVYGGVSAAPKKYTAAAAMSLVGDSTTQTPDDLDSLRGTVARLASSREVVIGIQDQLAHETEPPITRDYDTLRREITGQWVQGTVLVQLTVTDADPVAASEIANATAAALQDQDPSDGAFEYTLSNPARPPATYSSPDLLLTVGVGIVLALVLAACAALWRDRRTNTVRDAKTVEDAIGAPLLAHIPAPRNPTLQAMYTGTPAADLFRRLRISIEAEASGDPVSLVVVTGTASGDVNAWIAANLAISLANVGRRTLLIDGRMGGGAGRATGLEPNTPGLYEVLLGAPLATGVSPGPVDNMMVLPSGKWGAEPADELLETSFAELATEAKAAYDVVFVIAQSLQAGDDAVIMGSSGATIMVVVEGTVRETELARLSRRISGSGARLLGGLLVVRRTEGSTS